MNKNLLFVGSLFKGSTAVHRLNAIKTLFRSVSYIDQQIIHNKAGLLIDRLSNKLLHRTINSKLLNKKILLEVNNRVPGIIWIDKGLHISPLTLKEIKIKFSHTKIIHYSPDDMLNPGNQTINYLICIPLYDLHVTTKSYNMAELYKLGAKKVIFVNNAYAPEIHKPYILTSDEIKKYSADVSFVGGPEKERAVSINQLVGDGIKITIWGNGWSKFVNRNSNLKINKGWFADADYSKIICATKINLAFLRKANRDVQTTRTMEIPACGGFMLAERTDEHIKLFAENKEAVFFSDQKELKSKIEYFLKNEDERKEIAVNGLARCKESGYDNVTMIKNVLEIAISDI